MYQLNHYSHCGMSGIAENFDDRDEARKSAADMIRYYRRRYAVVILERGRSWEVLEPEDSIMVPDAAGTIGLRHVVYPCRECGCDSETREGAARCCADRRYAPEGSRYDNWDGY